MNNLCTLTISQMRSLLRSRKISRRELVQAHLDRIAAVNRVVNAVVELRAEAALAEASAIDANPKGRDALPLDGIAVSIKDHFDVEGMLHTEGVKTMAQRRSPHDEVAVKRLRDAGAIIIVAPTARAAMTALSPTAPAPNAAKLAPGPIFSAFITAPAPV